MATPGLIAFGAISQRPASDRLDEIRTLLQQQPSLASICHTLQGLKSLWKTLVNQDPRLESVNGLATATQLSEWITGTISSKDLQDNGNLAQIPLTILAQISQYVVYLRQGEESHEAIIESVALGGGVQGFWVGLLSALVVASAETENDLGSLAATSVRLAFCVGAYVDLECHLRGRNSQTKILAVRWRESTTLDDVENLIKKYSDVSGNPTKVEGAITDTSLDVYRRQIRRERCYDNHYQHRYQASLRGFFTFEYLSYGRWRLDTVSFYDRSQYFRENTERLQTCIHPKSQGEASREVQHRCVATHRRQGCEVGPRLHTFRTGRLVFRYLNSCQCSETGKAKYFCPLDWPGCDTKFSNQDNTGGQG